MPGAILGILNPFIQYVSNRWSSYLDKVQYLKGLRFPLPDGRYNSIMEGAREDGEDSGDREDNLLTEDTQQDNKRLLDRGKEEEQTTRRRALNIYICIYPCTHTHVTHPSLPCNSNTTHTQLTCHSHVTSVQLTGNTHITHWSLPYNSPTTHTHTQLTCQISASIRTMPLLDAKPWTSLMQHCSWTSWVSCCDSIPLLLLSSCEA